MSDTPETGSRRRLFVYGTLIDPAIRSAILGVEADRILIRPARLTGYKRVVVRNAPYPFLRETPGGSVEGELIERLSVAGLGLISRYEGSEYRLGECQVEVGDASVIALVYLSKRSVPDGPDWSYETWCRRHRASLLRWLKRRGGFG